jgi:hypothetical protein
VETRPAPGRGVLIFKFTLNQKDPASGGVSDWWRLYRPPGLVGPNVDPLGDVFIRLLPDAFRELLAAALAPPALKLGDVVPAWPVVPVDPLGGGAPMPAVPLAPVPAPAPAPPPAPPLCARASVLVSASANPNVTALIFILVSFAIRWRQTVAAPYVPALTRMRLHARVGV